MLGDDEYDDEEYEDEEEGGEGGDEEEDEEGGGEASQGPSKKPLIIVGIIALAALLSVVLAFFLVPKKNGGEASGEATPGDVAQATPAAAAVEEDPLAGLDLGAGLLDDIGTAASGAAAAGATDSAASGSAGTGASDKSGSAGGSVSSGSMASTSSTGSTGGSSSTASSSWNSGSSSSSGSSGGSSGTASRSEPTPASRNEPTPSSRSEATPTARSEPTPAAKSEPTPTAKSEPTPAAKSEPTPTAKSEPTPAAKSEPTPAAATSSGGGEAAAASSAPMSYEKDYLASLNGKAGGGGLDAQEIAHLKSAPVSDPNYLRAMSLVAAHFEAKKDWKSHCEIANGVLAQSRYSYNPEWTLEGAKCSLRNQELDKAVKQADSTISYQSDMTGANKPKRVLLAYQIKAKAATAKYEADSKKNAGFGDEGLLNKAIAAWKETANYATGINDSKGVENATKEVQDLEQRRAPKE